MARLRSLLYLAGGTLCAFVPAVGIAANLTVPGRWTEARVDGEPQTICPWKTWRQNYTAEPEPWHHDVFRADGTPYSEAEIDYIRFVTGVGAMVRFVEPRGVQPGFLATGSQFRLDWSPSDPA